MRRRRIGLVLLITLLLAAAQDPRVLPAGPAGYYAFRWADNPDGMPLVLMSGARYRNLTIERYRADGSVDSEFSGAVSLQGFHEEDDRVLAEVRFEAGVAKLPDCHVVGDIRVGEEAPPVRQILGFWALAPPLVAILLAIVFKDVLVALLAGIWIGVWTLEGAFLQGLLRTIDRHIIGAIANTDHVRIIVFSCTLGGVVAMISRMGGIRAIVEAVSRRGGSPRASLLTTWFAGILVFFDDYANALLVGNTMRPVTDRFRVSREKLAFVVDTTSAPVACIAPVSTWIATEVGYIKDWLKGHPEGVAGYKDGYLLFLDSIPYNFYPILALVFGLMVVALGRDFGPMLRAERRARREGKLLADGAIPLSSDEIDAAQPADLDRIRWWNGVLPILVLIGGVVFGLYADGIPKVKEDPETLDWLQRVRLAYGAADSYNVLLWASAGSLLVAWVLALGQRLMSLAQATETTVKGIKAMAMAGLVLILAWTLADLCQTLNTAGWLIEQVTFSFTLLPPIVFCLAAVVAFSTGSSWSTMGILVPLTLAYAWELGIAEGVDAASLGPVLLASLGGVLAGAVFGDHCSPISDTTVMSSMATSCDHMDHVRTQLPYAVIVGVVALGAGYLPAGLGLSPWLCLLMGTVLLGGILVWVGRRP